jgi:hypothetical protein
MQFKFMEEAKLDAQEYACPHCAEQERIGVINTALIERLNATFRANLPSLTRRTRRPARTVERLQAEMFRCSTVIIA